MMDSFYRAFEDKYRGSRELIKSRLLVYLPFTQPLIKAYPQGQALDLGCGRGEWLELLTEQGFNAKGVDLDDGMLRACRERGLQVETADAASYMQALPAESLCLVSAFHIAEHLSFDVLQQLVAEAKRVLVPGGLLIIETPNPENIAVGTNSFYLDPTHDRPIPPELLSFLVEYYGYQRSKVLRLQESAQLHTEPSLRLIHVLNGVSPDYALVAQTRGLPQLIDPLTPAFEQSYGLTLHALAERYQQTLDQRLTLIEAEAQQAQAIARKAQATADLQTSQLNEIYSSPSWRLTSPIRWSVHQWILLRQRGVGNRIRAATKKTVQGLVRFVLERPDIRHQIKRMAHRIGIDGQLKRLLATLQQPHPLTSVSNPSNTFSQDAPSATRRTALLNAEGRMTIEGIIALSQTIKETRINQ